MRHIQRNDRAQSLLLPASVEDYVGADNPVRAIEAFLKGFNLAKAGFVQAEVKRDGTAQLPSGRPAQVVLLRLPQPGAFQPAVGSNPASVQRFAGPSLSQERASEKAQQAFGVWRPAPEADVPVRPHQHERAGPRLARVACV